MSSDTQVVFSVLRAVGLLLLCLLTTTDYRAGADHYTDSIALQSGVMVTREISAGSRDLFQVSLDADQLFTVSVEKLDVALEIVVYAPTDSTLTRQISHGYEALDISLSTSVKGLYRIEVISRERDATRQYQLRVECLRRATIEDKKLNAAQQDIARASVLRSEWTESALRQALSHYDAAASVFASAKQMRSAAVASISAGETCIVLGEYREALTRFHRASAHAKVAQAQLEQARSLSQIGRLYSYLGNNDRAAKSLAEAISLLGPIQAGAQPGTVRQAYAEALSNRGEVNYAKGDLVTSRADFDQALKLFTEISDRRGEARVRLFKGYIAGTIGDTQKAVDQISQALNLFRAVGDKSGEGLCLTTLGLAHSQSLKKEVAVEMHHQAAQIFRTIGDRQSEATTLNALGQTYEFLKDYPTALHNYEKALQILQHNGFVELAAVTLFKVARTHRLMRNFNQALAHCQQSLKLSREAQKKRTEASALNELALIQAAQKNRAKTVAQYQRLIKFYAASSDRRGQITALNALGDFLLGLGETRMALRAYEQALPLCESTGDKVALVNNLYNLARANRELENFDDALSYIGRSISTIEELRSNVANPEVRTSYFAGVRTHYELLIDVLMQFDRLRPDRDFGVRAFSASENARARSLIDLITASGADIRSEATDTELERERELRGLIRSQAQYAMTTRDEAESVAATQQINELKVEYLQLRGTLRKPGPGVDALSQPAPSVAQIQAELLDDDSILLEYALGKDRSYLWAVTRKTFTSHELPSRPELEARAFQVYQLLTERQLIGLSGNLKDVPQISSDRIYQEAALQLSRMLLGPVAEQLGKKKRVIIVSEGVLQYIPIDALPDPGTGSESNHLPGTSENPRPLLESHEVVTLPSVSTLAAIRRQGTQTEVPDKMVAVLADPVFTGDDDRVRTGLSNAASTSGSPIVQIAFATRAEQHGRFARLLHSGEEADAILAVTPVGQGIAAEGFNATRETAIRSLAGKYKIVHFATHSIMNNEHPELSGIVLSMVNEDGSKSDGFMPLRDIYNLNDSPDLVVLSACDTALGKDITGEGLVGLTYGFMAAGSKTVVASLWQVDDRATAALMRHFYKSMLQEGMTPPAALKSAKEHVRRQKGWEAPYFWAGFVLQGEYAEQLVKPPNSDNWHTGFALAVMLPLLLFGSYLLFKRNAFSSYRP